MSTREARRITIMDECIKGIRTNQQAAQLPEITKMAGAAFKSQSKTRRH
ncbi:MAG: hypothetical protein DDT19_02928 [Syntrophomonadaceae bacterium]|nr:hypothetical protein [Bacillota bacterium]